MLTEWALEVTKLIIDHWAMHEEQLIARGHASPFMSQVYAKLHVSIFTIGCSASWLHERLGVLPSASAVGLVRSPVAIVISYVII